MARPPFSTYDSFKLTHRNVDAGVVRLGYALTALTGARLDFEETFELPATLGPAVAAPQPAIERALLGLHLAAGTSYWKTFIPRDVAIESASLSPDDLQLWSETYTLGMGEFFYRNDIDPADRISFRASPAATSSHAGATQDTRGPAFLLWGGGKDSVVAHEVLAASNEPHELLSIGRSDWEWVKRSAEIASRPLHVVVRRLDPKLHELNAAGALNGHVPVSAVLATAGTLIALLHGRSAVIASNESSASQANATWRGIDVNHQWSKSLAFERLFRRWLRASDQPGPDYFSILRPLTELRIMKAFATHQEYFRAVTSCNANFRQTGPVAERFCLTCPKCVFVALIARPWLDDPAYHALFGGDALGDPANLTIVEQLLGVRDVKPFECVGTPDETLAAIHLARTRGHLLPHGIMTALAAAPSPCASDFDACVADALTRSGEHELSEARLQQLDDYLARH